jgi:hypothetical protein
LRKVALLFIKVVDACSKVDPFSGASEADIRAACGFGRSHIYQLTTERCWAQHPDGNVTCTHGTQLRLKLGHIFCCVSALIGSVAFFITN